MRFRLGVIIGFGAGYYFGAKAGRERYEQIDAWLTKARDTETFGTAGDKARAVVDLTVERARDLVDRGRDSKFGTTTFDEPATGDGPLGTGVPNRDLREPPDTPL